jgi:hypothetical protein
MNASTSCLIDTLRLLLEEARQSNQLAETHRGHIEEAYFRGHSDALVQSLHTWVNQIETFGLTEELDDLRSELLLYLKSHGY